MKGAPRRSTARSEPALQSLGMPMRSFLLLLLAMLSFATTRLAAQFPASCDNDKSCVGNALTIDVTVGKGAQYVDIDTSSILQSLDTAIRNLKQIKVFLRDEGPLPSLQKQIAVKGEGEVSLVLILDDGAREIEMKLPGRYAVSPQVASALRAVRGVEQVEMA